MLEDDWDNAALSALAADVPKSDSVDPLIKSAEAPSEAAYTKQFQDLSSRTGDVELDILRQRLRRLKQRHIQRKAFFVWAIFAISAVIAFSVVFFSIYLAEKGSSVEPEVMIAWLSVALVETLGLGYIIANSLFKSHGRPSKSRARNAIGREDDDRDST